MSSLRLIKKLSCLLVVQAFAFTAVCFAAYSTVTVIHKKTSIRADKQFFAPAVATAKYMDKLKVIEEKGGWYKVSFAGKTGWVHGSAVAGGKKTGAGKKKKGLSLFGKKEDPKKVSQDDVALAGKGFNEQVEKDYKKKNPKLAFKAVDEMEKINVEDKKLAGFIKAGNLKENERVE